MSAHFPTLSLTSTLTVVSQTAALSWIFLLFLFTLSLQVSEAAKLNGVHKTLQISVKYDSNHFPEN